MKFIPGEFYHVYNQGNNRQQLFFSDDDYKRFMYGIHSHLLPSAQIFAYCLMPNHFHFLLRPNETCSTLIRQGSIYLSPLSNGFRKLLSYYAQATNAKFGNTGSMFRQKTKSKWVIEHISGNNKRSYFETCLEYIHQNPVKAGLVKKPEDWKWSSYNYLNGIVTKGFCCKEW